jgi:hypothetical protein
LIKHRLVLVRLLRLFSISLTIASAAQLNGCATPSEYFAESAKELGLTDELLRSHAFIHRIYQNKPAQQTNDYPELHVYLDGDGTPWENNRRIASDPTARNPLILHLMALDNSPSILLGRPCYYGLNQSQNCSPRLWTSHRYALPLVESLVEVLHNWLQDKRVQRVVLIGFSGGGALATLIASKIPAVKTLITLSANLDTAAWTKHHGYSELSESLNPAQQTQLPATISQVHFAAEKDTNVPATIVRSYADRQPSARFRSIKNYDHTCCWTDQWPELLSEALNQ